VAAGDRTFWALPPGHRPEIARGYRHELPGKNDAWAAALFFGSDDWDDSFPVCNRWVHLATGRFRRSGTNAGEMAGYSRRLAAERALPFLVGAGTRKTAERGQNS